jgi:hypothetical protein
LENRRKSVGAIQASHEQCMPEAAQNRCHVMHQKAKKGRKGRFQEIKKLKLQINISIS